MAARILLYGLGSMSLMVCWFTLSMAISLWVTFLEATRSLFLPIAVPALPTHHWLWFVIDFGFHHLWSGNKLIVHSKCYLIDRHLFHKCGNWIANRRYSHLQSISDKPNLRSSLIVVASFFDLPWWARDLHIALCSSYSFLRRPTWSPLTALVRYWSSWICQASLGFICCECPFWSYSRIWFYLQRLVLVLCPPIWAGLWLLSQFPLVPYILVRLAHNELPIHRIRNPRDHSWTRRFCWVASIFKGKAWVLPTHEFVSMRYAWHHHDELNDE